MFADAVRSSPVCKPEIATDVVISKVISTWFVNARDRSGGRDRRSQLQLRRQTTSNVMDVADGSADASADASHLNN